MPHSRDDARVWPALSHRIMLPISTQCGTRQGRFPARACPRSRHRSAQSAGLTQARFRRPWSVDARTRGHRAKFAIAANLAGPARRGMHSLSGADGRSRTGTPRGTAPSRQRVYQFHHVGPGKSGRHVAGTETCRGRSPPGTRRRSLPGIRATAKSTRALVTRGCWDPLQTRPRLSHQPVPSRGFQAPHRASADRRPPPHQARSKHQPRRLPGAAR